jgi:hypothetical protein
LDIGFVDHLQVVITNNYNTIAISTLYDSLELTLSLLYPSILQFFTRRFLITVSNNDYSSASVPKPRTELTANFQLTWLPQFSSL